MQNQQQSLTVPGTEVQPSNTNLKRQLEDAFTPYPNKIARLEMETSSDKSRLLRVRTEIHDSSYTGKGYKGKKYSVKNLFPIMSKGHLLLIHK